MSADHRYILEKYAGMKTRYECPECGRRHKFSRYVDTQNNNEYLADHVGRCGREVECGYHYTPKQHFAAIGGNPAPAIDNYTPCARIARKQKVNIPIERVNGTMTSHKGNRFVAYLHTLFAAPVVRELIKTYKIGSSNGAKWWKDETGNPLSGKGQSAVFWFINKWSEVRAGQVKLFDSTGHTAKYYNTKAGEPSSCTGHAYHLLRQAYKDNRLTCPDWLTQYIEYGEQNKNLDCFFGEHLLNNPKYHALPVAVVESPKACIVASVFFPQYIWLAAGSLSYLTPDRCSVLKGKQVVLFPDLGVIKDPTDKEIEAGKWDLDLWEYDKGRAFNMWKQVADKIKYIASFTVSDILEQIATDGSRAKGLDLCDYLETDEVRRELIEAYKSEMNTSCPAALPDGWNIWIKYRSIGLRECDLLTANNEIRATFFSGQSLAA